MSEADVLDSLRKRRKILRICVLGSLLVLVFTYIQGKRGVDATWSLIQAGQITPEELFRTIRFWFWTNLAAVTNYAVFFSCWYFVDNDLMKNLTKR